jgi:hypothetical protein
MSVPLFDAAWGQKIPIINGLLKKNESVIASPAPVGLGEAILDLR